MTNYWWDADWRERLYHWSTLLRLHVLHMLRARLYRHISLWSQRSMRKFRAFKILNNNAVFINGKIKGTSNVAFESIMTLFASFSFRVHNGVGFPLLFYREHLSLSLFFSLLFLYFFFSFDHRIRRSNDLSEFWSLPYLAPGTIQWNIKLYAIRRDRSSYGKGSNSTRRPRNCGEWSREIAV